MCIRGAEPPFLSDRSKQDFGTVSVSGFRLRISGLGGIGTCFLFSLPLPLGIHGRYLLESIMKWARETVKTTFKLEPWADVFFVYIRSAWTCAFCMNRTFCIVLAFCMAKRSASTVRSTCAERSTWRACDAHLAVRKRPCGTHFLRASAACARILNED